MGLDPNMYGVTLFSLFFLKSSLSPPVLVMSKTTCYLYLYLSSFFCKCRLMVIMMMGTFWMFSTNYVKREVEVDFLQQMNESFWCLGEMNKNLESLEILYDQYVEVDEVEERKYGRIIHLFLGLLINTMKNFSEEFEYKFDALYLGGSYWDDLKVITHNLAYFCLKNVYGLTDLFFSWSHFWTFGSLRNNQIFFCRNVISNFPRIISVIQKIIFIG